MLTKQETVVLGLVLQRLREGVYGDDEDYLCINGRKGV